MLDLRLCFQLPVHERDSIRAERWTDWACQVVKFAVEVGAYGVRGNHDDLALHALQYPNAHRHKRSMPWLEEFEPEQVCGCRASSLPTTVHACIVTP